MPTSPTRPVSVRPRQPDGHSRRVGWHSGLLARTVVRRQGYSYRRADGTRVNVDAHGARIATTDSAGAGGEAADPSTRTEIRQLAKAAAYAEPFCDPADLPDAGVSA